jgi:hypothetical protein
MSRRIPIVLVAVCAALTTLSAGRTAWATDRHWNVGTGLWTQSADWSPAGVPQAADNAIVDFFNSAAGTGGVAQLATSNVSAVNSATVTSDAVLSMVGNFGAGSLMVNDGLVLGSSSMSGTLNVLPSNPLQIYTGGMTVLGPMRLGVDSGAGTVNQNAGTVNVNEYIQPNFGLAGVVGLGSSHSVGSPFKGTGVYNLSGGLLSAQGLLIADGDQTTGTFNLSGSGKTSLSGFFGYYGMQIGNGGTGAVNQTGGTIQTDGLSLGYDFRGSSPPAGTNVYTMSGGSLSVSYPSGAGFDYPAFMLIQTNALFNYKGGQAYLGSLDIYPGGRLLVGADGLTCSGLQFLLSPQGVVDLKDHSMLVGDSSPGQRDALKDALASGYNGGAWTGAGINSSVANFYSTDAHRTAVGMAPVNGGGGYQLKYTYSGDANLDRTVDLTDFTILASNFNRTGKFWYDGDFNYDGTVDLTDFTLLASNFNQSLPAGGGRRSPQGATVPEPGAAMASVVALVCVTSRRRRRR